VRRGFADLILCRRSARESEWTRSDQRHATGDAGGDEGNLLARCQLSCSRPLRCLGRLIALVVRVLRAALAEQVRAFAAHGGAAWDGKRRWVDGDVEMF
jgi:hypothetical protein